MYEVVGGLGSELAAMSNRFVVQRQGRYTGDGVVR